MQQRFAESGSFTKIRYLKLVASFLASATLASSGCATVDHEESALLGQLAGLQLAKSDQTLEGNTASSPGAHSEDAWKRLRARLRFVEFKHPRIDAYESSIRSNPPYLLGITKRAQPYLAYIAKELERRKMPAEFALLPAIESTFKPFARSPAGAAGLWQIMPATGRSLGLSQSHWYDGRLDVVDSTRAALDYLQALSAKLDGDWLKTMAAYNAGLGTVNAAVKRNRRAGKKTDFWSLKLPGETRAYVPRLLALGRILARPGQLQNAFEAISHKPYFQVVTLDGPTELRAAAAAVGAPIDEVHRLNPGFIRGTTGPKGPHRLLLATNHAQKISAKAITEATTSASAQAADAVFIPAHYEDALSKEVRRGLATANRLPRKRLRTQTRSYTVRPGDSLWLIARRHDTTVVKLKRLNNIGKSRHLKPGHKLRVPAVPDNRATSTHSTATVVQPRANSAPTHVVRAGESLWLIARRYGTSVKALRKLNGLSGKQLLQLGQVLKLKG